MGGLDPALFFCYTQNVEQDALNTLRDEIHQWHLRNYPKDDLDSALLGVYEEYGELCRTQLKQDGGIRGTWEEWQLEKFKEAGDVMIGLLNVAGFLGVPVSTLSLDLLEFRNLPNIKRLLLNAGITLGYFLEDVEEYCIDQVFIEIVVYLHACKLDPIEALKSRWETISKRDFIKNPATGGREQE